MSDTHCERFPNCMVVGIGANVPVCEETDCPGRTRQNVARTIAAGLLEPRTNDEIKAAIIEECVRVAEICEGIAAAIRAMKDKQLRGNLSGFKKAVRRRDIEIERLRAENEHLKLVDYYNGRNAVIEECARKVDQMLTVLTNRDCTPVLEAVAETIRELKDKP